MSLNSASTSPKLRKAFSKSPGSMPGPILESPAQRALLKTRHLLTQELHRLLYTVSVLRKILLFQDEIFFRVNSNQQSS